MNAAARLAYRVNIQRHDLAARVEPAENCPGLLIRVPVAELQTAALVPLRERVDMGESFRRGVPKVPQLAGVDPAPWLALLPAQDKRMMPCTAHRQNRGRRSQKPALPAVLGARLAALSMLTGPPVS